MIHRISLPLFVFACHLSFAQINFPEFDRYRALNEAEIRLPEFKDSDSALYFKLLQLEVINKSRAKFHAPPVELDIFTCRLANRTSMLACMNNYSGHWDLAGLKPYQRYGYFGGYDHVSENASSYSGDKVLNTANNGIPALMKECHAFFMAEHKPRDGHKKNIIDPVHNYVGIGYYLQGDQFRYYEEFIDRYFQFGNIPQKVRLNEQFTITLSPRDGAEIASVCVYRELFPRPLTPPVLNNKGPYPDFGRLYYIFDEDELSRGKNDTNYRLDLKFQYSGIYYIQAFIKIANGEVNFSGKPLTGIVIIAGNFEPHYPAIKTSKNNDSLKCPVSGGSSEVPVKISGDVDVSLKSRKDTVNIEEEIPEDELLNDGFLIGRQHSGISFGDPSYVNGISFAWVEDRILKVNGLSFCYSGNFNPKKITNGVEIGMMPYVDYSNGLMFALFEGTVRHKMNGFALTGFLGDTWNVNGISGSWFLHLNNDINGLTFSGLGLVSSSFNGIGLSGLYQRVDSLSQGIALTGFVFLSEEHNGISLAPVNILESGRGLQVGLFNKSARYKGFQVGLINIISGNRPGFRVLPFINFSFRSFGERHLNTGTRSQENIENSK